MQTTTGIVFRRARAGDAEALAPLVEELGYPTPPAALRARLERLLAEPEQTVLVAAHGRALLGWVHVQEFLSLASAPAGLITGLAVAPAARRRGVGRGLVGASEDWARARGLDSMRLRARVTRSSAHAFYRVLGYEAAKQQVQFRKSL